MQAFIGINKKMAESGIKLEKSGEYLVKRPETEMQKPLTVMALESEGQGLLESMGLDFLYCGVGKLMRLIV
jgi:hypothetical protein